MLLSLFVASRRWQLGAGLLLVLIWTGALFHHRVARDGNPWSRFGGGGHSGAIKSPAAGTTDNFDFSIKPIAYIFPQFHPIPENDKNWGVNFTDWDNVKKVTHNNFGLETLRPAKEVGYYNLLDYDVRARQAQLIRDMGFYGVVFHHYWFQHPVMEKVPELILKDGQPDVPFMLSWANEPWTSTWDGSDQSKVIQAQDYGDLAHWRVHFDWLLQFFKHPNYIRVNGKVQFMIYNPGGLGETGVHMFAAWRKWAIEAGLPGMDIIETRVQPEGANNRGVSDAMSEFLFRSGSGLDGTEWAQFNRVSRVYHRGASVSWDNTPRYRARGSANIFAHPKLWRLQMLEIIRRMKLEPNPRGEENFLFVNALNEWGEGNVLEPSVQWGDSFSKAARDTVDSAEALLPWKDDVIAAGYSMVHEINTPGSIPVDVCVLVRMFRADARFSGPDTPSEMLASLVAQTNKNWRAVAFRASSDADGHQSPIHVLDTYDPRVTYADIPQDILDQDDKYGHGLFSTQHVLANLKDLSPACAGARYLLVTDHNATYTPSTFATSAVVGANIVGLNFITPDTMATALDGTKPDAWNRYCTRLHDKTVDLCAPATPDTPNGANFILGAALFDMVKIRTLSDLFVWANTGMSTETMTPDKAILDRLRKDGWTWASPPHKEGCNLVFGNTYLSCGRTGKIWLDMPSKQTTYPSQCLSLHTITAAHGWLTEQWDMASWRANPFCLRVSEERYNELFAPPSSPPTTP